MRYLLEYNGQRLLWVCIIVALAGLISKASATDFNTQLLGQDNKPITECVRLSIDRSKCEEETNITLGWLVRIALDLPEDKLPISDIIRRGSLSEKIKANPSIDLSVDEAKIVKDQIGKLNYRTTIKYQAVKLIDPKGTEDVK